MKFKESKIIKNFDYPVACQDMHLSESGNFLASVGTYKPSVKIHDLVNIAQKSDRHLESDALKILSLTKNCEKLALLRVDRYIEFHVKYGMHERIRVPKMCYDLKMNNFNANLLACGKSPDIYRFDLLEGRFVESYKTNLQKIMSCDINNVHGLIGYCGDKKIEFIDQRSEEIISTVEDEDLVNLSFSENGLNFATGSAPGQVKIFDLRSKKELNIYAHKESIRKIKMVGKSVVSVDKEEVIIFSENEIIDRINVECPINTFDILGGVIFLGLDDLNMRTFYCSDFGFIPDWFRAIKVE
ncbi:ribosome biogenesis protein ENP2 [Vairimorpha necatrix]|uniref:Ribosome biogenesis protein ENP2 n=1 Tax=Vairimorpha necatrix TaxID=6039 RepID=A0AAX4JFH7_9MICR